jgi:hypothetical protein
LPKSPGLPKLPIGKLSIPGVELCKPFGILVEPWGEGAIAVIAGIADIARDRKSQTLEPHWESDSTSLRFARFRGRPRSAKRYPTELS